MSAHASQQQSAEFNKRETEALAKEARLAEKPTYEPADQRRPSPKTPADLVRRSNPP
jgi:hypothetical protein